MYQAQDIKNDFKIPVAKTNIQLIIKSCLINGLSLGVLLELNVCRSIWTCVDTRWFVMSSNDN